MRRLDQIEEALRGAGSRPGPSSSGLWACPVPSHGKGRGDRNPSLKVFEDDAGRVGFKCFSGCSTEEILAALGLEKHDLGLGIRGGEPAPPKSRATTQLRNPFTVADYAAAKGLPVEFLAGLGVSNAYSRGRVVSMSYMDEGGAETGRRFRLVAPGDRAEPRFSWRKGDKARPYGLWRLREAREQGTIVLVEGESDCHTLWFHGIPAMGIPGAAIWKDEWRLLLEGVSRVYIHQEPDDSGTKFVRKIGESFEDPARVRVVSIDGFKDPSELHLDDPETFATRWASAVRSAVPFSEILTEEQAARIEALWNQCADLARAPDVLSQFLDRAHDLGVVGEDRNLQLIYLAMTSRLSDQPTNIVVKGQSSAGKSFGTDTTVKFFPESAYIPFSSMSERALIYDERDYRHRMLIIAEQSGAEGEVQAYLIRTLLSEKRIIHATVEKNNDGRLTAREIIKDGPTGLIVTTTKRKLHPENETRMLSLPINDSAEQTRAILLALAEDREQVDFTPWHALQEWLATQRNEVVIPYKREIADQIPPVAVRLRRDFGTLLSLIRAHAVLHQSTRQKDAEGRIIATFADYSVVRALVIDLMSEGVQANVSETVAETVAAVRVLLQGDPEGVTATAVSKHLGLDKSTASRRIKIAAGDGYLVNEAKPGRQMKLRVGDAMPDDVEIFPTLEALGLLSCGVAPDPGSTELPLPSAHAPQESIPSGQAGWSEIL